MGNSEIFKEIISFAAAFKDLEFGTGLGKMNMLFAGVMVFIAVGPKILVFLIWVVDKLVFCFSKKDLPPPSLPKSNRIANLIIVGSFMMICFTIVAYFEYKVKTFHIST